MRWVGLVYRRVRLEDACLQVCGWRHRPARLQARETAIGRGDRSDSLPRLAVGRRVHAGLLLGRVIVLKVFCREGRCSKERFAGGQSRRTMWRGCGVLKPLLGRALGNGRKIIVARAGLDRCSLWGVSHFIGGKDWAVRQRESKLSGVSGTYG